MALVVRFLLTGLLCFTVVRCSNVEDIPPQANPNHENKYAGLESTSFDPVPRADAPEDDEGAADDTCDLNAIVAATGDTVVGAVKSANSRCIYRIGTLSHDKEKQVCNDAKVKAIADAFAGDAAKYEPSDSSKTPDIENYLVYLRVCYYLSFNGHVDKLSEEVLTKVRAGIKAFLQRPNLDAENDDNYRITYSVIRLIANARDSRNYLDELSKLFFKVSNAWKFTPQSKYSKIDQGDVINAIFFDFFNSHRNVEEATKYYCQHPEIPQTLDEFMDRHNNLVNTSNEYALRNAGGELAHFLKYKCLQDKVDGFVEKQLKVHNSTAAHRVWLTLVVKANRYGSKKYGGGKFRANVALERKTLPYTKACPKTRNDTFIIRGQSITPSEYSNICAKLKYHESYFHNLVKDNWRPVTPDTNDKIEVVVFNNVNDYKYYANLLFGINTNNGGMYIEDDPSRPGNVARYFCYKQGNSIWNLEHEFTHYLDGRYDMKGKFSDINGGRRIWWVEGVGEYAAYKNQHPSTAKICKGEYKNYPLSTIFSNTYSDSQFRIYDYGYLATRFMFERHRSDVETMLRYFRAGQYSQYESWFAGIYKRYDQEFKTWCPRS